MPYLDLSNYEHEPIAFLKTPKGDMPIFKRNITIGRDSSNDIVLENVWVSRKHCQILYNREKHKFQLRDIGNESKGSTYGTYVDGKFIKNSLIDLKSPSIISIKNNEQNQIELVFIPVFGALVELPTSQIFKIPLSPQIIVGKEGNIKPTANNLVSRNHLLISFNFSEGHYVVRDVSTNGTLVNNTPIEKNKDFRLIDNTILSLAPQTGSSIFEFKHITDIQVSQEKKQGKKDNRWLYTQHSIDELSKSDKITKRSDGRYYYEGRPLIHRDSPIDGGVYLVANTGEAVVVDSIKYPEIKKVYEIAKKNALSPAFFSFNKKITEEKILKAVYKTVSKIMGYHLDDVEEIIKRLNVENNGKIALDVFIEKRIGVCRQQALLCGVLIELFIKENFLHGKISVDRNMLALGGHAWARYTSPSNEIWILDVAQHYFGLLKDAQGQGRWAYDRPEEAQF